MEMKWKLEMEIGNGNGNKKHTHHWCNVFFIVCLLITLIFCLEMVIGLAYDLCFAYTLVLCYLV